MTGLTPDAHAFLGEARYAPLATLHKDGSPQQATIWYTSEGTIILMNTCAGCFRNRQEIG